MMTQRIEQLDSLRGLAALTVVICHFSAVFPETSHNTSHWWNIVSWVPLQCIMAGHQAVVFFFVLSGFVLVLPFLRQPVPYLPWIIKRFCRIYLPYYGAIAVAIFLVTRCDARPMAPLTPWFDHTFRGPVTSTAIFNHLLLIGSFRNSQFNPIVWSLVVEMRISLVFPLLALLAIRLRWWKSLLAAYGIASVAVGIYVVLNYWLQWRNDYYLTFLYVPEFVVGCLLARYRQQIVTWCRNLPRSAKAAALVAATLLYTYPSWFFANQAILHLDPVNDFVTTLGIVIFIVSALTSWSASSILISRPLVALGKASYSLYLVHAVCLLAAMHLLFGSMPVGWILAIAAGLTLAATYLSYILLETPSIDLGRRLSARLAAKAEGPRAGSAAGPGTVIRNEA
jgi:peptidoglycan/LPS O-acetylase OafA/YrhL